MLAGASVACGADTMMKTRTVTTDSASPNIANAGVTVTVNYRHGTMRRREDSSGSETISSVAEIANCETNTGFLIDLKTHEYRNYKVARFASESQRSEYLRKADRTAVRVESKTVDTGERKVFFGHSAKHLITTTKRADANSGSGEETTDGWYIDHELPDRNCAPDFVRSEPYYLVGTTLVDYPDVAEIQHTGPLPTGLVIKLKFTGKLPATKDGNPGRTIRIEKTVEDLSDAPLSPSLFELPKGLHENPQFFHGHTIPSR
jgi:hypothetical protein